MKKIPDDRIYLFRFGRKYTPTTLSSVKPPFLWCVSGITTKKFTANYCQRTLKSYTARHVSGTEIIN